MSPGLMAESTSQHTWGTRIERNDYEVAVEKSPRGRNELPQESDSYIATDDRSNGGRGWGDGRPKAILACWGFVVLGEVVAETESEQSEECRCKKTLGL